MKAIAKSNIKHNGALYQTGEVLPDMTEVELSKLVAAGVIRIEGGVIAPEAPVDASTVKADKTLENEEREKVANLPIAMTLKKPVLVGIARANGLVVEKTATPGEVYNMIKAFRAEKGIVVEDVKVDKKAKEEAKVEAPKTPEVAPRVADSTPVEVPAVNGDSELPVDKGVKGTGKENTQVVPTPEKSSKK
jgi:hypothetical protein